MNCNNMNCNYGCCCHLRNCSPIQRAIPCPCVDQMKNLIPQLISRYGTNEVTVNMESGDNSSGRPYAVVPTVKPGVFQLANGSGEVTSSNNICRIVSIKVTSATYPPTPAITYLPTPILHSSGCEADCEAAIRSLLPIGTNKNVKAGKQTVATGPVVDNQYGVIVFKDGNNIVFVNTCYIEIIG